MSVGPIEKSRSNARLEIDEEKVPKLFQYVVPKTPAGMYIKSYISLV